MKRTALALVFVTLVPTIACAATPTGTDVNAVSFTVHNMAYNSDPNMGLLNSASAERNINATSASLTQVCIFCHTPHNASPSVPLWNKVYAASTAATYQMYTSSNTLSSVTKGAALTSTSESMLCLSCHDGKTAINVLHNSSVRNATDGNGDAIINLGKGPSAQGYGAWTPAGFDGTANIGASRDSSGFIADPLKGTNLTDDHPIGFSYSAVLAAKPNSFDTVANAKNKGIRFFGTTDKVECSSCHNPHVFYGQTRSGGGRVVLARLSPTQAQLDRTPFLVRDNNGSSLCLACHKK